MMTGAPSRTRQLHRLHQRSSPCLRGVRRRCRRSADDATENVLLDAALSNGAAACHTNQPRTARRLLEQRAARAAQSEESDDGYGAEPVVKEAPSAEEEPAPPVPQPDRATGLGDADILKGVDAEP